MKLKSIKAILVAAAVTLTTVLGGVSVMAETTQDTLVAAMSSDATNMDPSAVCNVYSSMVHQQIFDRLIDVAEDGTVTPKIAESYEVSEDGLTYTFKIRQGIKFHDGSDLTAKDVEYSLKRAATSAAVAHIYGDIDPDSFNVPDDYTVSFTLKNPNAGIIAGLAHTGGSIVPMAVVEADPEGFVSNPVGSGPFKFVSWTKNDSIELERFDDYYGDKPELSKITLRVITEATNRAIELESGGVDMSFDISTNDVSRVEDNSDLQLIRKVDNQTTFMAFNCEKEPWNNPDVRQAISYGIDTTAICNAVWRGIGAPAAGPIAPNVKYHDAEATPHEYNPEKAKELLAAAGVEEGQKLVISTNERQERIDMCTIMQAQLKEIGIDVEIEVLEWGALLDKANRREQDAIMVGWTCQTADPDMAVYAVFHSQSNGEVGNNYANFSNAEIDELLEKGRAMEDSDEREAVYVEIQRAIMEQAPWLFFNNAEAVVGAKANLKGFEPTAFGYHSLYNIYFE
ncbi:MAG: ABC transporter substrate-binding protein [Eubacteriales bacterium]|nr:ABC transporter substrate-binding protein [Eubacteriales bacterium]